MAQEEYPSGTVDNVSLYGPYETERQALAASMPRAVALAHDAGLVASGDPSGVARGIRWDALAAAARDAGVELGAWDRAILVGMCRGEDSPVQVVIGLLARAHAAGYRAAWSDFHATHAVPVAESDPADPDVWPQRLVEDLDVQVAADRDAALRDESSAGQRVRCMACGCPFLPGDQVEVRSGRMTHRSCPVRSDVVAVTP